MSDKGNVDEPERQPKEKEEAALAGQLPYFTISV
jgi:hypothetical protein